MVTNQSGGTITGLRGIYVGSGAAGTVVNAGSIGGYGSDPGIQLADGGLVTNQSGGVITGYQAIFTALTASTVTNAGSIGGNNTGSRGSGVWLNKGGTVTNISTGLITGNYAVVLYGAAGTAVNAGTITGNTANGTGAGVYANTGGLVTNQTHGVIAGVQGVWAMSTALTVQNAGSIDGNATVSAAAGVSLGAGGSVTNQSGGTISGYYGVRATGAAATVVNAGTIAGNYTSNYQQADGVLLSAGGTVSNLAGGAIYGRNDGVLITGAAGTVFNLGTIHSRVDATYGGRGISVDAGGLIVNGTSSGATASTAQIAGYNYAIQFGTTGTDTLINYGTVSGLPGTVAVALTTGTIINGPSGATGALIEGGEAASAILSSGVATVVNYATISAFEPTFFSNTIAYGISLGGGGGISNLGSHALIETYLPIYAAQGATVTNAGTIESQYGSVPARMPLCSAAAPTG